MRIRHLILFFMLAGCASVSGGKLSDMHRQIGVGFLRVGNYPEAYRELIKASELDPANPVIYNNLGMVCYRRQRYDQSIDFFKKAIKLDPNYSDAKNNLARTYIETKKFDLAKSLLDEVVKDLGFRKPEKAHDYLGLMYHRQNKLDEAILEFRKSIELNNKYCPAWYNYAVAQYDSEKFKETSRSIDLYINMCGIFEDALYYGGVSHFKSGKPKESRKFLRNLIKKYPNSNYRAASVKILNLIKSNSSKQSNGIKTL